MKVVDFTMPSLGADMDSGTITEWLVGVGDPVARGDVVLIVETDKADIDVEVWNSGVITDISVPVGETVSVGTPLAKIEVADAEGPAGPSTHPVADPPPPVPAPVATTTSTAGTAEKTAGPGSLAPAGEGGRGQVGGGPRSTSVASSPLARRLAGERGIDLATVTGTGPDGAIIARDLEAHPAERRSISGDGQGEGEGDGERAPGGQRPGTAATDAAEAPDRRAGAAERMRRTIADLMSRSKREIPHYYLETEVDLEAAMGWLEDVNSDRAIQDRVLPAALIMKAVSMAVAGHREFNGHWVDGGLRPGDGVHLGVAVSLRGGGLVAPAIHDADQLAVADLMAALRDLVGRARSGRLRASEMTDATLTLTNLGDRGVEVVHGVIHPPQVALIGVGRIGRRPAVVDDEVVARRMVTVTLAADHRASDGQRGARLLNTISRLLQEPEDL